jgi:hypothetical protein
MFVYDILVVLLVFASIVSWIAALSYAVQEGKSFNINDWIIFSVFLVFVSLSCTYLINSLVDYSNCEDYKTIGTSISPIYEIKHNGKVFQVSIHNDGIIKLNENYEIPEKYLRVKRIEEFVPCNWIVPPSHSQERTIFEVILKEEVKDEVSGK